MKRLLSRHKDNPSVTPEYLKKLASLTGARYERLLMGRWVSEEGLVYDNWDPTIHLVDRASIDVKMKWHFATVDWGYRAPGCFQVWGVDGNTRLYRLEEGYYTQKTYDWWADIAEEMHKKYDLAAIVCDPAEPRSIEMLNDRICTVGSREMARIAVKADNDVLAGLDIVRWGLRTDVDGEPKMTFVKDAMSHGRDSSLDDNSQACCTEEEFPGFVWLKQTDGRPILDKPDPSCPDHGLDCVRYAAMFAWNKDLSEIEMKPSYASDSCGALFNHEEIMETYA